MVEPALTQLTKLTASETHRLGRAIVAISANPDLGAGPLAQRRRPGIRVGCQRLGGGSACHTQWHLGQRRPISGGAQPGQPMVKVAVCFWSTTRSLPVRLLPSVVRLPLVLVPVISTW